jgi:hypothetical protein
MEEQSSRKMLLARMDSAFSDYSHEAEKLSVLLAGPRDPSSWTLYQELTKQHAAEIASYEKYRKIKDELFRLISAPPTPQERF